LIVLLGKYITTKMNPEEIKDLAEEIAYGIYEHSDEEVNGDGPESMAKIIAKLISKYYND